MSTITLLAYPAAVTALVFFKIFTLKYGRINSRGFEASWGK